jgi:hypothetical protein
MTASRLAPVLALLLAFPQQVFRSDVRSVPVYATVTDGRGAIVTSLTAADFELRDKSQKQPITTFAIGQQPLSIAILLDNSPSLFRVSGRAQEAIRAFAHQILPTSAACSIAILARSAARRARTPGAPTWRC